MNGQVIRIDFPELSPQIINVHMPFIQDVVSSVLIRIKALNVDLKVSRLSHALTVSGSAFHKMGAALEKERSPYDLCLVLGTLRSNWSGPSIIQIWIQCPKSVCVVVVGGGG